MGLHREPGNTITESLGPSLRLGRKVQDHVHWITTREPQHTLDCEPSIVSTERAL